MPHLLTQAQFQRWPKPPFCYLCGGSLEDGSSLNDDHCPPQGMFAPADRSNYPLKVEVHANCNHAWHSADETLAIFYDVLHGSKKASNPALRGKLKFLDVENEQGTYQGIANFPLRPLTTRIIRCAHALLYGEFLPGSTPHHVHYPIPEVDRGNGNRPAPHLPQTYQFANELCTAQRTSTYDSIRAYNGAFRYVCTWSRSDDGVPMCLFAFDIYRLAHFGVRIDGYPLAVIGFYSSARPKAASVCSELRIEHPDDDILYPLLET
jgi:hypothetical protein